MRRGEKEREKENCVFGFVYKFQKKGGLFAFFFF